jgi:hypothetical protein
MKLPKAHYAVDIDALSEADARFYRMALRKYREKLNWFAFEEIVFGYGSPMYKAIKASADVIGSPVYEALKAMWIDLGVQQGMVKPDEPKRAPRRK